MGGPIESLKSYNMIFPFFPMRLTKELFESLWNLFGVAGDGASGELQKGCHVPEHIGVITKISCTHVLTTCECCFGKVDLYRRMKFAKESAVFNMLYSDTCNFHRPI